MKYQKTFHIMLYFCSVSVVLCKNRQDVVETLLSVSKGSSKLREADGHVPSPAPQAKNIISLSKQEVTTPRVQAKIVQAKGGACQTYSKSPGICTEEIKCEAISKGKYFPKLCRLGKKVGVCCKIEAARARKEPLPPPPPPTTTTRKSTTTTKKPTTTTRKPTTTPGVSTKWSTVTCGQSLLSPIPTSTTESNDFVSSGVIHPRSLFQETRSIVGGETTMEGSQPWIVAVGIEDKEGVDWVCGGTLISVNTVLTGAHCTKDMTLDNVRVMVGNNRLDAGHVLGIEGIYVHPGWKNIPGWPQNDLAVLRIKINQDVIIDHMAPICLSSTLRYLENDAGITSGWGNLYSYGPRSLVLQSASVSIYTDDQCQSAYPMLSRNGQPPWDMLCASGRQVGRSGLVADSCQGDSGGPLVVERGGVWHLAGVVAGGVGCGIEEYPGVYVNVAKHLRWITQFL